MEVTVRKPTDAERKEAQAWGVWEKEISEFDWEYSEKEICLILEGNAQIFEGEGKIAEFGAGDYVVFPEGLSCTWKITKKIRKKFRFG